MAQNPSQRPPAIEARGLRKAYGRTGVLRGLDLDVPWGEVYRFQRGQGAYSLSPTG